MHEFMHTNLPTYLPTFFPSFLPTYMHQNITKHLSVCSATHLFQRRSATCLAVSSDALASPVAYGLYPQRGWGGSLSECPVPKSAEAPPTQKSTLHKGLTSNFSVCSALHLFQRRSAACLAVSSDALASPVAYGLYPPLHA